MCVVNVNNFCSFTRQYIVIVVIAVMLRSSNKPTVSNVSVVVENKTEASV